MYSKCICENTLEFGSLEVDWRRLQFGNLKYGLKKCCFMVWFIEFYCWIMELVMAACTHVWRCEFEHVNELSYVAKLFVI